VVAAFTKALYFELFFPEPMRQLEALLFVRSRIKQHPAPRPGALLPGGIVNGKS
jgi:hypothetical protein